jgi:hypothetical protein
MAAAIEPRSPTETGSPISGVTRTCPPPSARPSSTMAAIAPHFMSMSALWTLLPVRAPRQLMAVSPNSAEAAMAPSLPPNPVISR